MLKMKNILTAVCLLFSTVIFAQDRSLFTKHLFIKNGDTMPYRMLLPKNYDGLKSYPLIIVLHGSGERGNDNEAQLSHGTEAFLNGRARDSFPAVVIFPQCSKNGWWSNTKVTEQKGEERFEFYEGGDATKDMKLLMALVKSTIKNHHVNKQMVYAGGLSMGGMGTFELVRRMPKTFAAAFPICGGANPATAKKLKHTAWWVFHGGKDDVVLPKYSQQMVNALKAENAEVKFSLYPNDNHNSWDSAFGEKELLPWLMSHKK